MGDKPYKVGRFAHTLRVRLMREHLGVDVDAIRVQNEETIDWRFDDWKTLREVNISPSAHRTMLTPLQHVSSGQHSIGIQFVEKAVELAFLHFCIRQKTFPFNLALSYTLGVVRLRARTGRCALGIL